MEGRDAVVFRRGGWWITICESRTDVRVEVDRGTTAVVREGTVVEGCIYI